VLKGCLCSARPNRTKTDEAIERLKEARQDDNQPWTKAIHIQLFRYPTSAILAGYIDER
jgi:hypothetical protein